MLTGAYQNEVQLNNVPKEKKTKWVVAFCLLVAAIIVALVIAVILLLREPGSDKIKIADSGWSVTPSDDGVVVSVGAQIDNNAFGFMAKNLVIIGVGYDANKKEIFREDEMCTIDHILPGEKVFCTGSLLLSDEAKVDTVDLVINDDVLKWTRGGLGKEETSDTFEVHDVERNEEDGSISCMIKNKSEKTVRDIRAVLILRKNGHIVGGTWSSSEEEAIAPGEDGTFILSGFNDVDYDDYEVGVNGA